MPDAPVSSELIVTAVPPPVPPEIVEQAERAVLAMQNSPAVVTGSVYVLARVVAERVLAAVYGDIVEAARRDALLDARIAVAALDPFDEGNGWGAAIEAATEAVADLANRPTIAPNATVGDQDAVPRTPGTDEAQKRSEPFLTNAFAVTPETGRYLDETAPPRTPPCFTALGTEDPA